MGQICIRWVQKREGVYYVESVIQVLQLESQVSYLESVIVLRRRKMSLIIREVFENLEKDSECHSNHDYYK